jgi:hypothetical protein
MLFTNSLLDTNSAAVSTIYPKRVVQALRKSTRTNNTNNHQKRHTINLCKIL